jgi:hypothetical protein
LIHDCNKYVTRSVRVCENLWALNLNNDNTLGVASSNIESIRNELYNDDQFIKTEA